MTLLRTSSGGWRWQRTVSPVGGLLERPEVYEKVVRSMPEGMWTSGGLLSAIVFIGHAQLLRRQIAHEVSSTCKMDSNSLSCALQTMNDSLVRDVRACVCISPVDL